MCFNREGAFSMLNGGLQKLVHKGTYLGSDVSSSENDVDMCEAKAGVSMDVLSII